LYVNANMLIYSLNVIKILYMHWKNTKLWKKYEYDVNSYDITRIYITI